MQRDKELTLKILKHFSQMWLTDPALGIDSPVTVREQKWNSEAFGRCYNYHPALVEYHYNMLQSQGCFYTLGIAQEIGGPCNVEALTWHGNDLLEALLEELVVPENTP